MLTKLHRSHVDDAVLQLLVGDFAYIYIYIYTGDTRSSKPCTNGHERVVDEDSAENRVVHFDDECRNVGYWQWKACVRKVSQVSVLITALWTPSPW